MVPTLGIADGDAEFALSPALEAAELSVAAAGTTAVSIVASTAVDVDTLSTFELSSSVK
jgi:hypothetical protein